MREGWTYKKFEDCLVKAPKAKQVQTSEYNSGSKYPIISQEDKMISGYCDDSSLLYHIDNPVVIFGDHTRVLKYVDFDFVVGADGVKILIPKEFLKAKFLLYYLRWYQVPSLGYSRHYKLLKEIVLPVPPIAEQERIVAELDLLSGIIEKKKEQLKAYDQLAQSIFYTMFGDPIDNPKGWETKKLDELCTVITKGTTPTTLGFPFVEEGINFVKVESFINGRIDSSKLSHITHECNLALSRSKLEDKDLLVCIAGATIGKMAVVDSSILPANTNQACAIIRLKDKRTIRYIQSFLELKFENDVMQMGKGVAQPNLSLGQLRNLFLPMPPIGQRETFTTTLEAIERQKALVQQSIEETQTMFDYTMDKYFG